MRLIVQRVLRGAVRVADKGTVGRIDRGTFFFSRRVADEGVTSLDDRCGGVGGYRET
jgi:hypothetical protein